MKILVTGSRDWGNDALVERAIQFVAGPTLPADITIIHGAARGADSCADVASQRLGIVDVKRFPAQWDRFGKSAGFRRNTEMLRDHRPDVVLAFKDNLDRSLSHGGTEHMIRTALDAGVPVRWVGGPLGRITTITFPQDVV